jgi:hypothetical protein
MSPARAAFQFAPPGLAQTLRLRDENDTARPPGARNVDFRRQLTFNTPCRDPHGFGVKKVQLSIFYAVMPR